MGNTPVQVDDFTLQRWMKMVDATYELASMYGWESIARKDS